MEAITIFQEIREVEIVEVGPRDGLQNENIIVDVDKKISIIKALAAAGLKNIEATSFVHPKWVPQLADADPLMKELQNLKGVRLSVLIPNEKGFQRAIEAGVKEICLFVSASESHNLKNVNMTPQDSIKNFSSIINSARESNMRVRTIIVTAFHCPFEGLVDSDKVLGLAGSLESMGADEIILADTTGHANPRQVYELFELLKHHVTGVQLSAHFHDTMGMGLANVTASLLAGIRKFDSSVGGLGGCPYAPGARGNIATEDLVHMLEAMGIKTGINMPALIKASNLVEEIIGRTVNSHYKKTITVSQSCATERDRIDIL